MLMGWGTAVFALSQWGHYARTNQYTHICVIYNCYLEAFTLAAFLCAAGSGSGFCGSLHRA